MYSQKDSREILSPTLGHPSRGRTSARIISITGSSGYFARTLLPYLEADETIGTIRCFDRNPSRKTTLEPNPDHAGSKIEFHQVDLAAGPGQEHLGGDPQVEALLRGSDTLVHLAFELMRLPGKRDLERTNIRGMRLVCEAAARQGVRKLIITSSVVAYGMHPDNPPFLAETAPLRPNPDLYYGLAKAGNEGFLDDFERRHPEMIITRLRPCTTIGPGADPGMMASLTADPTILIKTAGDPGFYDPPIQLIHEEDVASAIHLAIQKDLPGPYNAAADDPQTLSEMVALRQGKTIVLPYPIVKVLMALTWRLGFSVFAPEWIDLTRYPVVVDNSRLKAAGWQPRYTTPQAFVSLLAHPPGGRG